MDDKLELKIRQLLAMAEHPNSNENEAAVALSMAQKLLLNNNLTRADAVAGETKATPAGIGKMDIVETVGFQWKRHILGVIARNSLCKVIGDPSNNTAHIFGTYDNVQGVLEMYNWIVPELERMAMQGWNKYRGDGTGRESARVWKRGYFLGASNAINKRLQETLQDFEQGTGSVIVPYNTGLVKEAIHRVFPRLCSTRVSSQSYDGRAAGRVAAQNMALRPRRNLSGGTLALTG